MLRQILAISLMSVTALATADTLDIGLSNTTAQFKYGVPSGVSSKSEVYAELMYSNVNSVLGGFGLLVANDESKTGLTLGFGVKAVAGSVKTTPSRTNASSVALGAQVRYELPGERRIALAGDLYYGPEIMTFGDAKHFQQYGARIEFSASPQVQVYGGYRKTYFTLKTGITDAVVINSPYVGLQLSF